MLINLAVWPACKYSIVDSRIVINNDGSEIFGRRVGNATGSGHVRVAGARRAHDAACPGRSAGMDTGRWAVCGMRCAHIAARREADHCSVWALMSCLLLVWTGMEIVVCPLSFRYHAPRHPGRLEVHGWRLYGFARAERGGWGK